MPGMAHLTVRLRRATVVPTSLEMSCVAVAVFARDQHVHFEYGVRGRD